MSVNEKMTALADAIRAKTGGTEKLSLDDMPAAIESIETGGGEDLWQYVDTLTYTFRNTQFPENTELVVNVPNLKGAIEYMIYGAVGVTKLKLKGNTANNPIAVTYPFTSSTLVELDLTEFGEGGIKFSACKGIAYNCVRLKYIRGELDFSSVTGNIDIPFNNDSALIEVRFKAASVYKNIGLPNSSLLSDDSIQSIIDGLADLSGQTAQTLTLHAGVGAKLTEAQKSAASAKNWTIAY